MKSLVITFILFISFYNLSYAQSDNCMLSKSSYTDFYTVDVDDARCIAKNSKKDLTIFYTYAEWCSPCRAHLPDAIEISKEYDVDFFLLLMDKEDDSFYLDRVVKTLDEVYNNDIKAVIITDSLYQISTIDKLNKKKIISIDGKKKREKYHNFLTEITPPQFENMNDMSKYIILNKDGDVLLVTNYKDSEGEKDDEKLKNLVKKTIVDNRAAL